MPLGDYVDAIRCWGAGIARKPGHTAIAFFIMASAAAVNGLTLAVFYAFSWRPLPFPGPSRLVWVRTLVPAAGLWGYDASPNTWHKIKEGARHEMENSGLVSLDTNRVLLRVAGGSVSAIVRKVTPSVFSTLGIPPALGRWPARSAGHAGGPRQALISHEFWERAFGGRKSALGAELALPHHRYQVVGVLPPHRTLPFAPAAIYVPLVRPLPPFQRHNLNDYLFVRLRPSVSLHHFNLRLGRIASAMMATVPVRFRRQSQGFRLMAVPMRDAMLHLQGVASLRWIFLVAGLFVWVLAVVNLTHHALVRGRAELHETAVRRVLGATRWRLSAGLLAQQVPLALLSWGAAVPVAILEIRWFSEGILSGGLNRFLPIGLNDVVVLGMLVLTAVGLFITVIVPLWQMKATVLWGVLGEGRGRTMSRQTRRFLQSLSVSQIALAVGLLTGGLVSATSLFAALHRPLGFDPRGRVVARVLLPRTVRVQEAWYHIVHHLEQEPYVSGAAFAVTVPWSQDRIGGDFRGNGQVGYLNIDWVSRDFFRVLGIPFMSGQSFGPTDVSQSSAAVILGNEACHAFFGNGPCLSRTLRVGVETVQVAGIVVPVSWQLQPWSHTWGTAYLPTENVLASVGMESSGNVIVSLRNASAVYQKAVRDQIEDAIPGAVVLHMQRYGSLIRKSARYSSDVAQVLVVLAIGGIAITLLGVYAVQNHIRRWKMSEYHIRAVLGASSRDFRRLALRAVLWQVIPGCILGSGAGLLVGRLLGGIFYKAFSYALWIAPVSAIVVGLASSLAIGWPATNVMRALRKGAVNGNGTYMCR